MKTIAEEAQEIICGPRRDAYGDAGESFKAIAAVWSAHLRNKLKEQITAQEVAILMAAFKLLRESNKAGRDNRVDVIGYMLLEDQLICPTQTPCEPSTSTREIDPGAGYRLLGRHEKVVEGDELFIDGDWFQALSVGGPPIGGTTYRRKV